MVIKKSGNQIDPSCVVHAEEEHMSRTHKDNEPKRRNAFALHASRRTAVKFKDRRQPRGGARNLQREYREEW